MKRVFVFGGLAFVCVLCGLISMVMPKSSATDQKTASIPPPASTSATRPPSTNTLPLTSTPDRPHVVVNTDFLPFNVGPGEAYGTYGSLKVGGTLGIIGKTPDGAWLQVQKDTGDKGWVSARGVTVQGSLDAVTAIEPPATPTPIPTKPASPTNPPKPQRAKVDGAAIRDLYTRTAKWSFTSAEGPGGVQRYVGRDAATGLASMFLDGNQQTNLDSASLMIGFDGTTASKSRELLAAYLLVFVKAALPEWENGVAWVEASVQAMSDGQAETTNAFNGRNLTMTHANIGGADIIILTIK